MSSTVPSRSDLKWVMDGCRKAKLQALQISAGMEKAPDSSSASQNDVQASRTETVGEASLIRRSTDKRSERICSLVVWIPNDSHGLMISPTSRARVGSLAASDCCGAG